jgi:tetratricopeptide (TPR) repeat protein
VLEKLPLFAAAAGVSLVTLIVQRERGFLADEEVFAWSARLANAVDACRFYLGKSLWPSGLAVFYPHPGDSLPAWRVLASAAGLAAVTAASLRLAAKRPYFVVGWLWYLGMLVPTLGLVQVGAQAAADRYMYLPQIGLSLLPAFAVSELQPRRRAAVAAAACAALAALAVTAFFQVRHWRDTTALFEQAIAVTENNAVAHSSLGAAYERADRLDEAVPQLAEAVRIRPGWSRPRIRLADVLARQGLPEQAVPHYQEALRREPGHTRARINLAQSLIQLGRFAEAETELRRAAEKPKQLTAVYRMMLHRGLGRTAWEDGRPDASIRQYRLALRVRPDDAAANLSLGLALVRMARFEEARAPLARAAQRRPADSPAGIAARAAEAAAAGRTREAVAGYREALRLRPDLPLVSDHLAWLLATAAEPELRDPAEAIRRIERASPGRVEDPLRLDTLAAAYAASGRPGEAAEIAEVAAAITHEADLESQLRTRLELYRNGESYMEVRHEGERAGRSGP